MTKTTMPKTTKTKATMSKSIKTNTTTTKAIGRSPRFQCQWPQDKESAVHTLPSQVEMPQILTISTMTRVMPERFSLWWDKLVPTRLLESFVLCPAILTRCDYSLVHKVDLVDIYYYYERHPKLAGAVSTRNFVRMVGLPISKGSIDRWINNYEELKEPALNSPEGTIIRIHRKNTIIDKTLLLGLEDQRKKNLPVNGGQISDAVEIIYIILLEVEDDHIRPHDRLLFSAAWVTGYVSRNEVVHLDLIGESGSVNLDDIQEELQDIRSICNRFRLDNIYNCDEAGMYLLELSRTTFTTQGYLQGFKPNRECRANTVQGTI
ncbi:hypothetical protein BG015_008828 [Linnemannia schmuckeri]|uniref:Transposase n=1 Tax=Linnemannia schmuckeri TaxID=64567 RepID=A0A9P5RWC7_9FUNG|nr:hypothetical protein BG015_008828 [Linnemannia schmuckeri]